MVAEKRFGQLAFGHRAIGACAFERGQLVNHGCQFGLIARPGLPDDLGHGGTSRADRIVLNFVVVSATSSSGSDWRRCRHGVRVGGAASAGQLRATTHRPSPR
jgi:hypothetical protein